LPRTHSMRLIGSILRETPCVGPPDASVRVRRDREAGHKGAPP
jgi:hypothetical protein